MATDWLRVVLYDNRYLDFCKARLTTVGELKELLLPSVACVVCHEARRDVKLLYGDLELHNDHDLTWPDRVYACLAAQPCIHEKNAAQSKKTATRGDGIPEQHSRTAVAIRETHEPTADAGTSPA